MFISTNTDSIDAEFTTLYVVVTRTTHKNSQQIDIVAGVYISLPMANNLAILLASMPAYQLVVRSESNSGCKEIMGLVEDIRTDIIVLDFGVYFSQSENGFVLVAGGKVRGVYLQMPRAEAAALCRSNTGQKGVRIEVWEVDRSEYSCVVVNSGLG